MSLFDVQAAVYGPEGSPVWHISPTRATMIPQWARIGTALNAYAQQGMVRKGSARDAKHLDSDLADLDSDLADRWSQGCLDNDIITTLVWSPSRLKPLSLGNHTLMLIPSKVVSLFIPEVRWIVSVTDTLLVETMDYS